MPGYATTHTNTHTHSHVCIQIETTQFHFTLCKRQIESNGKKRALRQLRLLTPFVAAGARRCRRAKIRIQKRQRQWPGRRARPHRCGVLHRSKREREIESSARALAQLFYLLDEAQHQWNWYTHTRRQAMQYASIPVWATISCCCCGRLEPASADDNEAQHVHQKMALRKSRLYEKENLGKSAKRLSGAKTQKQNRCRIKRDAKIKTKTEIELRFCSSEQQQQQHWSRVRTHIHTCMHMYMYIVICMYVTHLNKPGTN